MDTDAPKARGASAHYDRPLESLYKEDWRRVANTARFLNPAYGYYSLREPALIPRPPTTPVFSGPLLLHAPAIPDFNTVPLPFWPFSVKEFLATYFAILIKLPEMNASDDLCETSNPSDLRHKFEHSPAKLLYCGIYRCANVYQIDEAGRYRPATL